MQRLIVVYNPNSSQYVHVRNEALEPFLRLKGVVAGKFAIEKAPFEQNVKGLKSVLKDGDTVVAAGGDATAAVAVNAILESKKDVLLGVLPYGNFNDLARTLGTMNTAEVLPILIKAIRGARQASAVKLYPLDVTVDGKHWRYATCYVTMGMTAESVELFDEPKVREKMQKGHKSSWRSYVQLAIWYFKNRHKKVFIPEFQLNGKVMDTRVSDYAAVNGRSMSRVMKGGDDFLKPKVFRSAVERTTNFAKLFVLMAKSILSRVPGCETMGDTIEFKKPARVELQAEGEYKVFEGIRKIEVKKPSEFVRVIYKK